MKKTYALLALKNKNPKAFSGKRLRQNSKKLAQLKKREKRLSKIGLSVVMFGS